MSVRFKIRGWERKRTGKMRQRSGLGHETEEADWEDETEEVAWSMRQRKQPGKMRQRKWSGNMKQRKRVRGIERHWAESLLGKCGKGAVWLVLVLASLIVCFPVFFAVSGAFSAQWELERNLGPVLGSAEGMAEWSFLPLAPALNSPVELLMDSPQFFVMFWNSVKLSLSILAGQMAFGIPAAWGLARFSFPGKGVVQMIYLVLMLMPFQVLMLPEYIILNGMGLLDTHWAVILPAVFSTFPVFIMQRFFHGVPEAVLEAARIDGAGNLQIFCYIGLPLGLPGVISAGLLGFLESWNMIEQPQTFLKTKALWPLSLFLPEIGLQEAGLGFAASLLMLVPALLLFLCGQEYLEQGIAAAAVKE